MKINCQEITESNKRCVYKLSFEDGSFYIGSTKNLRQRLSSYNQSFNKDNIGSINKLIAKKALIYTEVNFSILEIIPLDINTKHIEDIYLKENSNNPLLLNRSKSAYNNSGMTKSNQ